MLSDPVQILEPSFNLYIHSPLTSSFPQKTQRIEPGLETWPKLAQSVSLSCKFEMGPREGFGHGTLMGWDLKAVLFCCCVQGQREVIYWRRE